MSNMYVPMDTLQAVIYEINTFFSFKPLIVIEYLCYVLQIWCSTQYV